VSIVPQAYFVSRIGGDAVSVQVLVPPGESPETYEPTIAQVEEMSRAKLYVKVGAPGLGLEQTWFKKALAANPRITVVDSAQGVDIIAGDPHIWLSPRAVKTQAENICRGLIRVDPARKPQYLKNRDAFLNELDTLETDTCKVFAGVKKRRFLVFHPAWTYFARDFALQQIAIEDEGKDPSMAALDKLVAWARQDGIKVVYVEPRTNPKGAQVVADAIGARVEPLDHLARDWEANLREVARRLAREMD
jgi:zinc transport system substrate-binding protein